MGPFHYFTSDRATYISHLSKSAHNLQIFTFASSRTVLAKNLSCYISDPEAFVEQLENTETFVEQLKILRTQFPELKKYYLHDHLLEELLINKELIVTMQNIPVAQRLETKEKMLEDACINDDDEGVDLLLWLDFPITQSLIKRIDSSWVKKLIPSIEPILHRLQYFDNINSLSCINRKELSELVLLSFIEEANSESHDIVDERMLEVFIKKKLHELQDVNEQDNTHVIKGPINFKIRFFELKERYDPHQDDAEPSIYELY